MLKPNKFSDKIKKVYENEQQLYIICFAITERGKTTWDF